MTNKKFIIIALCCLTVVGSLFAMLASNMFFGDIVNIGVIATNGTLPVTIPAISVALFFVLAVLYIIRTYMHPDCRRRITRLYSIYLCVFGVAGIVGVILSAVKVYGSFVPPYPFPGYLIIFLILNLCIVAIGVCGLVVFLRKLPDDTGRVKISFGYVMKTIGWFLFICLLFNRFGTFLTSPTFIYWRNFNVTWPFYLYLLMPVYLGVVKVLYILRLVKHQNLFLLFFVGFGLNVVFFAYIAINGMNDTTFISSVSPAMPLERIASKPLEILIHFLAYNGVGAALIFNYKDLKKEVGAE